MKHIQVFENFGTSINEDGYGRDYFFRKKDGKTYNYYYKISSEEDGESLCFVLGIGKLSRNITIEDAENSYCVLNIQKISESVMDDFLVNDSDYKDKEDEEFKLTESELMRFYDIVGECIKDYLKNSPKVSRIYDQMGLNIDINFTQYKNVTKSLMDGWSYGKWAIQSDISERTLIYTKRDHD
jgi:hypothetical protein